MFFIYIYLVSFLFYFFLIICLVKLHTNFCTKPLMMLHSVLIFLLCYCAAFMLNGTDVFQKKLCAEKVLNSLPPQTRAHTMLGLLIHVSPHVNNSGRKNRLSLMFSGCLKFGSLIHFYLLSLQAHSHLLYGNLHNLPRTTQNDISIHCLKKLPLPLTNHK